MAVGDQLTGSTASEPTGAPEGALRRGRLGVAHIVFFIIAASAPLTVVAGGVPTSYAVTGIKGIPLVYIIIAAILVLFSVGYAAMSRQVSNAGAFYAYVARGINKPAGVGASFVALVAYNTMQIGIYGLFGFQAADLMASEFGWHGVRWWAAVFVCIGIIGVLGLLRIDLNAQVLAVMLVGETIVVTIFDAVSIGNPAGGSVSGATFAPSALSGGVGAALCFVVASFVGFESAAIYGEEARNPRRDVARATYIAVISIGIFYALSAWAMSVATGPDQIVGQSQQFGPGLLFELAGQHLGSWFLHVANWLFLTSLFAALLSFHNAVARYLYALGREGVLPSQLGRVHRVSGSPQLGSITQTVLAVVVVAAFAISGSDPVLTLFTWLTNTGALGVILLMALTSLAVIGFFRSRPGELSPVKMALAVAASAALIAVFCLAVANFDVLMGEGTSAWLRWGLPGLLVAAAIVGTAWGYAMRQSKPAAYQRIGYGEAAPDVVPVIL